MNQAMYPPSPPPNNPYASPQQYSAPMNNNAGGFQQVPQNLPPQNVPQQSPVNSGQQYGANTHQNNTQYNDKIDPLFNTGFSFNNLLTLGFVRRTSLDPSKKDYKERYFFFMSMIAGVGERQNRTYDFNKKISMKFSIREICSIGFILKQCGIGNDTNVLPYIKFANDGKQCSIWTGSEIKTISNRQVNVRQIFVSFTSRSVERLTIALSPAEAYGIGETCEFLFHEAMKYEIEIQQAEPKAGAMEGNYADNFNPPAPNTGFAQPDGVHPGYPPQTGVYQPVPPTVQYPQQQQPGGYTPQQSGYAPPMGPQNSQSPMGTNVVAPTNPGFGSAAEQTQQTAAQFGQMLNTQFQR